MGEFVRVGSVEKLKEFRVSLCSFAQTASTALGEANSEIKRTINWLEHDRYTYWKAQIRHCSDRCAKAKRELKLKKEIEKTALGGRCAYDEEQKAFYAAQRELEQAQQKFDKVRHWIVQLEKEAFAFKGLIQGLTNVVEIEIPNARAEMDRMVDSLEAYAALATPIGMVADSDMQGEDVSFIRGSAEVPIAEPRISYQKLRAGTPRVAERGQIQVGDLTCRWPGDIKTNLSWHEVISSIGVELMPVLPDDKIVIVKVAGKQDRIYLERTEPGGHGDSGWYIGRIDDNGTQEYEGIRVADLLDVWPGLGEILSLPVGYLVVLNGDSIEAVVDPNDEIVTK